jgi:hypothetical protein
MDILCMMFRIPPPGRKMNGIGSSFIQRHSESNEKLLHLLHNQHPGQEWYITRQHQGRKDLHLLYHQLLYTVRSLDNPVCKVSEEDPTGFQADKEEQSYDKDEAVDVHNDDER